MTDGKTRVWGLIGNPVEHTLSPLIQNTFAEAMGVNAVYVPLGVKEDLESAIKGAAAFGFAGMNVTVPYKREVMKYLKAVDPAAVRINAVNTLKLDGDGYMGFNTDVSGFVRQMEHTGVNVVGRDVIVLGAGGASGAILDGLRQLMADHIYLLNRSVDKALALYGECTDVTVFGLDEYKKLPEGRYVCVQCTSVGLPDTAEKAAVEDEDFYQLVETGVDLIYNPAETAFMKKVKAAGGKAFNGSFMLLFQAADSFEKVYGIRPDDKAMDAAKKALGFKG